MGMGTVRPYGNDRYDSKPGGDSAVVRYHGKNKGIAATVDCVPRYCKAHPKSGAMQAVCETWRI